MDKYKDLGLAFRTEAIVSTERKKNVSGETLVEKKEKVCGLLLPCITGGSDAVSSNFLQA